jgi:hypothetical protein
MNVRLIAAFFIFGVSLVFADDDDKPVVKPSKMTESGAVFLSAGAQSISGLETLTLLPMSHHTEFVAYGKAVNIQPLLELRHRYLLALSEQRGAVARFKQADQSIKRQQDLYRDGATSKRNLQSQQAQWQTDKAQVDATGVQGKAIVDEARMLWGKKLTDWTLSIDSDLLGAFLSGRKVLLQVTLPVDRQLAMDIKSIEVEASGKRSAAIKAELVSAALQTDTTMQGESYFFQADGSHIRAGMRVAAWIPEQGEIQSGVVIPKSALVWHLDQAFVYVKNASEHFSRRNIEQLLPVADGYFVKNGLNAGDQLVITGGQMLLSEEFKGQIPNEDD